MAEKDKKGDRDEERPEGEGAEGDESLEEGGKKKKIGGKKLIMLVGGGLVLLVAIGAGLYLSGVVGGHKEDKKEEQAKAAAEADKTIAYYDMGDILVNLSGEGKRPVYLKIKVSLELADEKDKARMDQIKPRILDNFQVYLREIRLEDLKGSAGIYRLREELLMRVTEAAHPVRVRDVLFQEMLVQ